ncbi:MAG: Six-hairpin glycosidase-like protein, partial [Olpidium bornovanus]
EYFGAPSAGQEDRASVRRTSARRRSLTCCPVRRRKPGVPAISPVARRVARAVCAHPSRDAPLAFCAALRRARFPRASVRLRRPRQDKPPVWPGAPAGAGWRVRDAGDQQIRLRGCASQIASVLPRSAIGSRGRASAGVEDAFLLRLQRRVFGNSGRTSVAAGQFRRMLPVQPDEVSLAHWKRLLDIISKHNEVDATEGFHRHAGVFPNTHITSAYQTLTDQCRSPCIAIIIAKLAFSIYIFGDAMAKVNEKKEALKILRWGAQYFINGHPAPNVLIGVLGLSEVSPPCALLGLRLAFNIDFGYFGPPEEYEQWVPMGVKRQAFYVNEKNPSSEMAGSVAAALAATSVVWKNDDAAFADECLRHAKELFSFADKFRGTYRTGEVGFANTKQWYPSSGFLDELGSAAVWLHIATNEAVYLQKAQNFSADAYPVEYSWDQSMPAVLVLLYKLTGEQVYADKLSAFFRAYLPGGSVKRTPKGLSYYLYCTLGSFAVETSNREKCYSSTARGLRLWGSLRYAANHAFLALAHAKLLEEKQGPVAFVSSLRNFAVQQINYMLGDSGRSWEVGFGENFPKLPYHKGSYNSFLDYPMRGQPQGVVGEDFLRSPTPNRFILYGALVGGPRDDDSFVDDRTNYEFTEVTQDYNAYVTCSDHTDNVSLESPGAKHLDACRGFTGALAGLIDLYLKKGATFKLGSDCNLDLGWGHPNADEKLKPVWPAGDCYHTCDPCSAEIIQATNNTTNAPKSAASPPELRTVLAIVSSALILAVSAWLHR